MKNKELADIVQWGAPKVYEGKDYYFYDYMAYLHWKDKWKSKYPAIPLPNKKNIAYIRDIPSVQLEDEGFLRFVEKQKNRHREVVEHLDGFIAMSNPMADHIREVYGIDIPYALFRNHPTWFDTPLEKRDEFVYIGAIPSHLNLFIDALEELESYSKKICTFVKYDPQKFASGRFDDNGKCLPMSEYDYGSKYGLLLNVDNFNQAHELIVRKLPMYLMCGIYPVIHSSFIEAIKYCRATNVEPVIYDHIDDIPSLIESFKFSEINRHYYSFEERQPELMSAIESVSDAISGVNQPPTIIEILPKPSFTADWFSGNISNWEIWLAKFKNKPNLRFIEIGCFEGMSTLWLLDHVLTQESAKITVIDTFEGGLEHKERNLDMSDTFDRFTENISIGNYSHRVTIFKGKSREHLRNLTPSSFDFIYIDGSHVASDVIEDAVLSWNLLKQGGIIVFDDYKWRTTTREPLLTPKPAIDSFLRLYKDKYKLIAKEYQVCIEKL